MAIFLVEIDDESGEAVDIEQLNEDQEQELSLGFLGAVGRGVAKVGSKIKSLAGFKPKVIGGLRPSSRASMSTLLPKAVGRKLTSGLAPASTTKNFRVRMKRFFEPNKIGVGGNLRPTMRSLVKGGKQLSLSEEYNPLVADAESRE